jgi:integrase/recombinase XerD
MLNGFTTYLQQNEYSETTIEGYLSIISTFLNWCNRKDYDIEQITYTKWIEYQKILKDKPNKDRTVKHQIGIVRLFFDYLVEEDIIHLNPIKDINYKADKDYYHDHLSDEELYELYFCYPILDIKHPSCPSVAIRNKVVIGLVIFQAIDTNTLKKLTIDNIDLENGQIYIPSTIRSNSRTLSIKPTQLKALKNYLDNHRPILQNKINCHTRALFPLNTKRFNCITYEINKKLKTINLKVTNLKQIRSSVITLWVKKYNLRACQIMCGHRYISSTERYLKTDKDSLEESTKKYHPLG